MAHCDRLRPGRDQTRSRPVSKDQHQRTPAREVDGDDELVTDDDDVDGGGVADVVGGGVGSGGVICDGIIIISDRVKSEQVSISRSVVSNRCDSERRKDMATDTYNSQRRRTTLATVGGVPLPASFPQSESSLVVRWIVVRVRLESLSD